MSDESRRAIDVVGRARIEQLRKDRWQNILGHVGASPAVAAIAWGTADQSRLILFVIVHYVTVCVMAVSLIVPLRRARLDRLPLATYVGMTLPRIVLGGVLWFDPTSARGDVFVLAAGISLFALTAGSLVTLGNDPRLLRFSLTCVLAPYFLSSVIFGHIPVAIGTLFYYLVVGIVAVARVAEGQDELVGLRVTEAERAAAAEKVASTDQLTGLVNRHGLAELKPPHDRTNVAVLFVDLDHFKKINDTHGHAAGDETLRITADRIARSVRSTDVVARLGGDEFVVIAYDTAEHDARRLASAIERTLSAPMALSGSKSVTASASVGVAHTTELDVDLFTLISESDRHMYEVKAAGRIDARRSPALSDARIEELDRAFADDEFELWFQPIVDLDELAIVAAEGLIRWRHPIKGVLTPDHFLDDIVAAERSSELADLVLYQAVAMITLAAGHGHQLRVAVNLTAADLRDPVLKTKVSDLLVGAGVPASQLSIELIEDAALSESGDELRTVRALADFGVRTSLDDFGTGYSSLERLGLLPLSEVKIDRSFVQRSAHHPADRIITQAMVDLSRYLHLSVVAEGIETQEQLELMRGMGCHLGQGWLFAAAMPATDLLRRLDLGPELELELGNELGNERVHTTRPTPGASSIALTDADDTLSALLARDDIRMQLGLPILEHMPVAAFIKGTDGRFLWSNTHHDHQVLGLAEAESAIKRSDADVHRYNEALRYREDDLRVLVDGQSIHGRFERQLRPDGTWVQLRTTKLPILNAAKMILGLLGFSVEVPGPGTAPTPDLLPTGLESTVGSERSAD